jgi:hypothetical protein
LLSTATPKNACNKYRSTSISLLEDFRAHMRRFLGAVKITSRANMSAAE